MTVPTDAKRVDHPAHHKVHRLLFPFITAVLFIAAMVAINHVLDETSISQIVAELRNLSYRQIGLALLCTLASYWVLSGYDWMAIRYLGLHLPYPIVALATFCSCAISYTVGANLLSGGSVRYRIYVGAGLTPGDVVRITLFGMIAFSVGTTVVAAMALCIEPEKISELSGLSSHLLRNIGLATLGLCAVFILLTFLKRTPVRIGRWRFTLPSGPITVSQLVVSVVDMLFAGGCLYVLISNPEVPFIAFLIVYSWGFVAGIMSHVPGGLGVFDGIMLIAFNSVIPAESMAAALVVYRVIYYLIPLILAAGGMAIWELAHRDKVFKRRLPGR